VAKISGYSDPAANDPARRDDILLAHVCLSIGSPVLLVPRSGASAALTWDVSGLRFVWGSNRDRFAFFSRTHSIFLPMMACRLMLSLKKAASEPTGLWSLSNPSSRGQSSGTIQFVAPVFDTSDTIVQPAGDDIELGDVPGSPRKSGSP
jgi:hypothetical protein